MDEDQDLEGQNLLLGELAADAALERKSFLVDATDQLRGFLDRHGDRIRELGGRKIRTRADVEAALSGIRIGQKLPLIVEREGQRLRGEIIVAEKP